MILTVTLNASVDIRFTVKEFRRGGVFRSTDDKQSAGGKGLNVTRVLAQLGAPVLATGLLGGCNGDFIATELDARGIEHAFVRIAGNTRVCIAILEEGVQTEVLGRGPNVSGAELEGFFSQFRRLLPRAKIVTLSGGLPPGVPAGTYGRLIEAAKGHGVAVILDTSGAPLAAGIKAGPFAVKPNRSELETLVNRRLDGEADLARAMSEIAQSGVENVIVSLGAQGALALVQGRFYRVTVPRIKAVNPVGSGDATVAGLAWGIYQGLEVQSALALAAACGVSNAMELDTGCIDPAAVEKLITEVKVERMAGL